MRTIRPTPITVKCDYCDWSADAPGDTPLTSVRWLRELCLKHVAATHPEKLAAEEKTTADLQQQG